MKTWEGYGNLRNFKHMLEAHDARLEAIALAKKLKEIGFFKDFLQKRKARIEEEAERLNVNLAGSADDH